MSLVVNENQIPYSNIFHAIIVSWQFTGLLQCQKTITKQVGKANCDPQNYDGGGGG